MNEISKQRSRRGRERQYEKHRACMKKTDFSDGKKRSKSTKRTVLKQERWSRGRK